MRRTSRLAVAGALATIAFAVLAAPAGAQSACSATANGGRAESYDTPDHALEVRDDDVVSIVATATGPGSYDVELELAGAGWNAASGTFEDDGWSDEVDVAEYAKHGVGIYKVVATSENAGGSCAVTSYVNVTGRSPLSTTAGRVAAASIALGLAGTVASAVRSSRRLDVTVVGDTDVLDGRSDPRQIQAVQQQQAAESDAMCGLCASAVLLGIGLTLKAMAQESAHHVVAAIGGWWR